MGMKPSRGKHGVESLAHFGHAIALSLHEPEYFVCNKICGLQADESFGAARSASFKTMSICETRIVLHPIKGRDSVKSIVALIDDNRECIIRRKSSKLHVGCKCSNQRLEADGIRVSHFGLTIGVDDPSICINVHPAGQSVETPFLIF